MLLLGTWLTAPGHPQHEHLHSIGRENVAKEPWQSSYIFELMAHSFIVHDARCHGHTLLAISWGSSAATSGNGLPVAVGAGL